MFAKRIQRTFVAFWCSCRANIPSEQHQALSVSADQLLADTNYNGYKVKDSLLAEKLEKLSPADRQQIYDVIDAMLKHTKI